MDGGGGIYKFMNPGTGLGLGRHILFGIGGLVRLVVCLVGGQFAIDLAICLASVGSFAAQG